MELYVIRHGQTATNACKGMVGRKQIYSLTEKGEQQAIDARGEVESIDYDFVICSPLERAKRTCELVNVKGKEVIEDDRIMERDCGEMEGKPKESFDYPHYWNYNYDFDFKGMTPIKEFVKTIWGFIDDIKQKYPNSNILKAKPVINNNLRLRFSVNNPSWKRFPIIKFIYNICTGCFSS